MRFKLGLAYLPSFAPFVRPKGVGHTNEAPKTRELQSNPLKDVKRPRSSVRSAPKQRRHGWAKIGEIGCQPQTKGANSQMNPDRTFPGRAFQGEGRGDPENERGQENPGCRSGQCKPDGLGEVSGLEQCHLQSGGERDGKPKA